MRRLGIDIGSLTLSMVLLEEGRIVARHSCAHEGRPGPLVKSLVDRAPFFPWECAGVTGSLAGAGKGIIDNTLATIEGARRLLPTCGNLIAMGGQSFSLILLDGDGRYIEHVSNPPCASGTGSFLEQQAERLGLGIQDFAERAAAFSGEIPRIATRCAVFAKTDIVHAMQEGYCLDAICAGLCEGIARSMLDMLLKGRRLPPPVGLVGGVALNGKIATDHRPDPRDDSGGPRGLPVRRRARRRSPGIGCDPRRPASGGAGAARSDSPFPACLPTTLPLMVSTSPCGMTWRYSDPRERRRRRRLLPRHRHRLHEHEGGAREAPTGRSETGSTLARAEIPWPPCSGCSRPWKACAAATHHAFSA